MASVNDAIAPAGGRQAARPAAGFPSVPTLAKLGLIALCAGTLAVFFVYPTYPNYDSIYSLIWGRELLHGHVPSFEAYRAPTQHPLWIALGALLSLFGQGADRALLGLTLVSFVLMAVAVYRLGRASFTALIGLTAAALVVARLDFPFLAIRGYIDVPYLCLVVWAAALEAERPKRGGRVWVLLICAGMMRPEAWVFLGLYVLWLGWSAAWADRIKYCAYAAIAPLVWCGTDLLVTGDALYSLHYTTRSAELLGRQRGIADIPSEIYHSLVTILRTALLAAGIVGFFAALKLARDRMLMPAVLLLAGIGTYCILVAGGFTAIPRYLFISALALLLFAAVTIGGFDLLERSSPWRRRWAAASVVIVGLGALYTVATLHYGYINRDLSIRGYAHDGLQQILDDPQVRKARACGPVSVPTYKLIPDTRWMLDAPEDGVIARTETKKNFRMRYGVAIFVLNNKLVNNPAYGPYVKYASNTGEHDSPRVQVPPPGFERIAYNNYFAAYARCA